jgi:cytochrome c oxidase subunit 3
MATSTATLGEKPSLWDGGTVPFGASYGKLMMWFFLLSDAFTFSALLLAYGAIRASAPVWPNPDNVFNGIPFLEVHLPLVFVSIMTFILIMSSVTMVLAVEAGQRGAKNEVTKWMLWTILGGIAFLSCQAWEWTHLHHEGFWWGEKPEEAFAGLSAEAFPINFPNLFFTITGFHGFHVFSGVIINIIITAMNAAGVFERKGHYEMVEKVGLYWHFVDLVWVFVFTVFYLV